WPPPWARMPGPYLPAADMRSIDAQGLLAADWMRTAFGPGNRLVTDRTNRLLMGAYAGQRPVTSFSDKLRTWKIFFAPALGPEERLIMARGRVHYLVVDRRLSDSLPATGAYFERSELEGDRHDTAIEPAALAKFDGMPEVGRLFDSGDIVIYDVARLR
ncbi:MAG TPA: hypothetical protein VFX76_04265, partial [Roseiflexaceae bacterium]|nr:hypothetical protein [Roseiflexaceae bacterium]